jgi:predicted nucleic acid-binding Zn ribbon protein
MSSRKATARQRLRHALLAEWRGVPDGPLLDCPLESVASLLPRIVAQCGIAERLQMEDVAAAWTGIVGDFIARQTSPDSIVRGVLVVRILQPAVHHALMMEKARILQKLRAALGASAVKDLRFKHG